MDKVSTINKVTITLAVLLYGIILAIQRKGFIELAYIGSIVFCISMFWVFVDRIGWKLPILRSFLNSVPDLTGKWEGSYKRWNSDHEEEIIMIIKQTWTSIVVRSKTGYADSISNTAHIVPIIHGNSRNTFYRLIFTWSAEAKDVENAEFLGVGGLGGTTMLMVDADVGNVLEGHYYTNMMPEQTRGEVKLQRTVH